jgi:hypothetical protein
MVRYARAAVWVALLSLLSSSWASGPQRAPNTPSPSAVGDNCQLPVRSIQPQGGRGGLVTFPGGSFKPDPASTVTYLPAMHRWVPVQIGWVAPDGRSYARAASTGGVGSVAVVDVASGAETIVWSGEAVFNLLAWLPSGIYFGRHSTGPEPASSNPFLWKVDPTTKAAEQSIRPGARQQLRSSTRGGG